MLYLPFFCSLCNNKIALISEILIMSMLAASPSHIRNCLKPFILKDQKSFGFS